MCKTSPKVSKPVAKVNRYSGQKWRLRVLCVPDWIVAWASYGRNQSRELFWKEKTYCIQRVYTGTRNANIVKSYLEWSTLVLGTEPLSLWVIIQAPVVVQPDRNKCLVKYCSLTRKDNLKFKFHRFFKLNNFVEIWLVHRVSSKLTRQ